MSKHFRVVYIKICNQYGNKFNFDAIDDMWKTLSGLGMKSENIDSLFDGWTSIEENNRAPYIHELINIAKKRKFIGSRDYDPSLYHCQFCEDTGTIWRYNLITKYQCEYRCTCEHSQRHPKEVMQLDPNDPKQAKKWFELTHWEWLNLSDQYINSIPGLKNRVELAKNYTFHYPLVNGKPLLCYFHKTDKEINRKVYEKYPEIVFTYPQYF